MGDQRAQEQERCPSGCSDVEMRERMARLETTQDQHQGEMRQLRQGLADADQKIEERFGELRNRLSHMEKLQNRTFWLMVGGFSIITGGGALILWTLRVADHMRTIFGGG